MHARSGTRGHRSENNRMQASSVVRRASVPTFGEIAARIGAIRATQEWLVLERDDQIIGFADGQPLKRPAAFQ